MVARRRAGAIWAALGLLVAAGCTAKAAAERWRWQPDATVVHVDTAYTSAGVRIAVERFAPADGRCAPRTAASARTTAWHGCPAVLVLHPSSGLQSPGGATVRRWADALARGGRVAYVVHYFDRTGDHATDDAREDAVFPVWTAALVDAVTWIRSDPAVDSTHVSAFGYSLGGYLALALGATDPRVSRLVVLSGGLFDTCRPRRLPPTLLLHGGDDRVVPLAEAKRAARVLELLGVTHRLVVYPERSHGLSADVLPDAMERVAAFLDTAIAAHGSGLVPARWTPAATSSSI
ncbi:MAG TPA: dienelactone hydrolase family protein, partial [Gemmatirosa sp.]